MRITNVDFENINALEGQCTLTSDEGVVSIRCKSLLPEAASADQHRIAWLQDALRQLRRMPEYRVATAEPAFKELVLQIAAKLKK